MKRLVSPLVLAFGALCAGCSEAPPAVDPVAVEQLIASNEALAVAEKESRSAAPSVEKKLAKADRIAGAVTRLEPKRIDPDVVGILLSR